ncbi:unnamed protein product [Notodromas monacha]|uniref:Uncharacterized protein n=1 Tax=Notodromas monacha TaxID=399045 RepID=A0A7R9BLQ7_9CRUS|nr:unnamed protein product [Notodromas monacha]CAG0917536.1 unnamed protein product [Notodromas monacha]
MVTPFRFPKFQLVFFSISSVWNAFSASEGLYPFGLEAGDMFLPNCDDCSWGPVKLKNPITVFGMPTQVCYVNTNGGISFTKPVHEFSPACSPTDEPENMIAPFWADVDTRFMGNVSFRDVDDASALSAIAADIKEAFPASNIPLLLSALVVTWHSVGAYGLGTTSPANTFQMALATDGYASYAIFNYESVEWTRGTESEVDAWAGLHAADGVPQHVYSLAASCSDLMINMTSRSNFLHPGKFVLQINTPRNLHVFSCEKDGDAQLCMLIWDPTKVYENPTTVQIVLHSFNPIGDTVLTAANNSGHFKVRIPEAALETNKPLTIGLIPEKEGISPMLMADAEEFMNKFWTRNSERCEQWYNNAGVPESSTICPPIELLANFDPRFEASVLMRNYYHPDADVCYRSIMGQPLQDCCYKNGIAECGLRTGGNVILNDPSTAYLEYLSNDVVPFYDCCKTDESGSINSSTCAMFYEKRPANCGQGYEPPVVGGGGLGDPHFMTLDGVSYTFNGFGEYQLIRTSDCVVQVRLGTTPMISTATAVKAVAMSCGTQPSVQVEADESGSMQIYSGLGKRLFFSPNQQMIKISDHIQVRKVGPALMLFSPRLSVLLTIKFGILENTLFVAPSEAGNAIAVGLAGKFDGDRRNDLMPRGNVSLRSLDITESSNSSNSTELPHLLNIPEIPILPEVIIESPYITESPISSISPDYARAVFYQFGETWRVSRNESIFFYPAGTSYDTFNKPDFVPVFLLEPKESFPESVRDVCQNVQACYMDYQASHSIQIAMNTLQLIISLLNKRSAMETARTIKVCPTPSNPANGVADYSTLISGSKAIITSDGYSTFAIFRYGNLTWSRGAESNLDAFAGFNSGRRPTSIPIHSLPHSCSQDVLQLQNLSNTGTPGKFVYQIDGDLIGDPKTCTFPTEEQMSLVTITPRELGLYGNELVTLSGLCLGKVSNVSCAVKDRTLGLVPGKALVLDFRTAGCVTPTFAAAGLAKIQFTISLFNDTFTTERDVVVGRPRRVLGINLTSPGSATITWDRSWFDSLTSVDIKLYTFQNGSSVTLKTVANTGKENVTISPIYFNWSQPTTRTILVEPTVTSGGRGIFADIEEFAQRFWGGGYDFCQNWLRGQTIQPNPSTACPPLMIQARIDPRFIISRRAKRFMHYPAKECYRSEARSVLKQQTCRMYYEKLGSDCGTKYSTDEVRANAYAHGDPIFTTFDRTHYAFNGFGEYHFIRSPDCNVQVRLRPKQGAGNGTSIQAVAVKCGAGNHLQIQASSFDQMMIYTSNKFYMRIVENDFPTRIGPEMSIVNSFGDFIISTKNLRVVVSYGGLKAMLVQAFVTSTYAGNTNGLAGNLDGDPTNDLSPRNADTPLPSNASLSGIHWAFGESWRVKPEETIFVYLGDDDTRAAHHDLAYIPPLEPALVPSQMESELCGNNVTCLFDLYMSGEINLAEEAMLIEYVMQVSDGEMQRKVERCNAPPKPVNGYAVFNGTAVGSKANFACDPTFKLNSTVPLVCNAGGVWTGAVPKCQKTVVVGGGK